MKGKLILEVDLESAGSIASAVGSLGRALVGFNEATGGFPPLPLRDSTWIEEKGVYLLLEGQDAAGKIHLRVGVAKTPFDSSTWHSEKHLVAVEV